MMKKIYYSLIIFILPVICLKAYAQTYYDAKIIRQNFDTTLNVFVLNKETVPLFKKYFLVDTLRCTDFSNNPFFKGMCSGGTSGDDKSNILSAASSKFTSIGGLDVTNIADGLAKFLIKRGKEELNIAFFQRMKDFLEENIEAKTLFPATSAFLGKIESYRYSELLQSLREAFYKDISNLVVNLNILIDLPKYQKLLKTLPEIRVAIRSAKIISELSQGDSTSIHPANLIHQFADLKEWGEMNINLQSSWKVLDRISESVRTSPYIITSRKIMKADTVKIVNDTFSLKFTQLSDNLLKIDTNRVSKINLFKIDSIQVTKYDTLINKEVAWIKFSDFHDNILSDRITLRIFLGLLYQRMDSVTFRNAAGRYTSVQDFMRDNKDDIFKVADLIENFLVLANDVEKSIKDIGEKKGSLTNDDYYTYIRKAIDVTEYGFKVANVIKPGIADDRYISMARNANDLYKNIYTKSYNAAVMNAYLILEEVLAKYDISTQEKDNMIISSLLPNGISPSASMSIEKDLKTLYLIYSNSDTIKGFLTGSINLSIINDSVLRKSLTNDISQITNVTGNPIKLDSLVKYLQTFTPTQTVPDSNSTTVEKILRYGNLMASIVKSDNSQEAEAAIEAAALPAGSSSIKKNSDWNISLNAYIGGYISNYTNSTDKIDGSNSHVGVTAPVGIAFSKGLGLNRNGRTFGSASLFLSIIDVGAIAGYRLNDDSTALNQKVTIDDIFAPGGYLVYGVGLPWWKWSTYIPLSVGYGWQYGSKLYYKKDNGTLATSDKSRWRSNWFLAIDIPLANLCTWNYKRKK